MLSDDDVNLGEMSDEELEAAWDLWFDLAQATNESDPPYTHGALAYASMDVTYEGAACHSRAWSWNRRPFRKMSTKRLRWIASLQAGMFSTPMG